MHKAVHQFTRVKIRCISSNTSECVNDQYRSNDKNCIPTKKKKNPIIL